MPRWTTDNIPSQDGKLAVVTGGNSGIGFETAVGLARAGASVIIACRDAKKGGEALRLLRADVAGAQVELASLDLSSLKSVRSFSEQILSGPQSLDLLINNAGIMAIPRRQTTADGFEMQLGVNHLGHFALTGLVLPALLRAKAPRVVSVSSIAHRTGRIQFDDLQSERSYGPWTAYGQSKLANLLFAFELQRRGDAVAAHLMSLGAHPGYSATNLQTTGPSTNGPSVTAGFMKLTNALMAQSAAMGALPTLYAATAPDVKPGGFYGPSGFMEMWGYPKPAVPASQATDSKAAAKLWEISEHLTGVKYEAFIERSTSK